MARIVFIGTPQFASTCLSMLLKEYDVIGVVTQPNRPSGRGRKLRPSEVNITAQKSHLPVITPNNINKTEVIRELNQWNPDVIVVAAYGQLLSSSILSLPIKGCVNVHASLLPRHRGASPIAAAIMSNDSHTGVTIMKMDAGMDTGPLLSQQEISIRSDHTTGTLTDSLAILGAHLLCRTLPAYMSGQINPIPQNQNLATYAPMMTKAIGHLSFDKAAQELERKVRAMTPWPGAFAVHGEQRIKILEAQAITGSAPPGKITYLNKNIVVGTGYGLLRLQQIQAPGKRPMKANDYVRGFPSFVGSTLE
jgi:methionyl-tRNA formyltransferase